MTYLTNPYHGRIDGDSNDNTGSDHRSLISGWIASPLKRVADIVLSSLLLFLALPIIAICYVLIRRDGGPGFFSQNRIGQHGSSFEMFKLRSMVVDADARLKAHLKDNPEARREWAQTQKLRNDPRVTRLGAFMRKTSIDELPQLWNVLRGEMSIVGPRPVVLDEITRYGTDGFAYMCARPGITGLWQVSGRNDVTYDERVELDLRYALESTVLMDFLILLRTTRAVLARTGY
ncbi:MAG: sugar transferase [Marinibacterium sp.]|nr:sugar transferase [Marinibacterium sp.]